MRLKELYYRAQEGRHRRQAIARLRRLERQLVTPETRLAVPFLFRGAGFFKRMEPMQSQAEIAALYRAVLQERPKTVVEIGTCHGGTLYLWCQAAHPQATLISIDLPAGEFGGGYYPGRVPFYHQFRGAQQNLHLLQADSHSPETLLKVKDLLDQRSIDFLFIDGDHTYAGVKHDFEAYSSLVRPGGIIALHDTAPRPEEPRIEVWKLWRELKASHAEACEWLDHEPGGRTIGIGLIRRSA